MELPSKLLERIVLTMGHKRDEHMLIVMDKSTHEEHLCQPLQTNDKHFKIAVSFLSAYNGVFTVTDSNNKFYFKKSLIEEDFIQITIPSRAYELETLNDEIKRIIIDKGHYTEAEYPFTIKPNFSTLCSITQIKPQGAIVGFVFNDGIRNLLGFQENMLFKEYNLSDNPVDISSFDNIFLECDITKGMIFGGGIIQKYTLTVDPGYKYLEKVAGGFT